MATVGKFNGDLLLVTLDGVEVAHTNDAVLTIDVELPDATTKSSAGWKEHIRGTRSWRVALTGLVDYSASVTPTTIFTSISGRTAMTMVFSTAVVGDPVWIGTVDPSTLEMTGAHDAPKSWSGTLEGTGSLVETVQA